jgi:hypothetical protein
MRILISGALKEGIVAIELTSDGKILRLDMPIEVDHPIVALLLRAQLERPIPFMCFINNSADTEAYSHPYIYRNLVVGVSHAETANREEIILRVKKFVLEREAKMERLRRAVTILEVTAPPKT